MSVVDDIRARVRRNGQVEQSAVTLIKELVQKVNDLKGDPVALEGLLAEMDQQADGFAADIVANTPAADPAPAPAPDPAPAGDTTTAGDTPSDVTGGAGNDVV